MSRDSWPARTVRSRRHATSWAVPQPHQQPGALGRCAARSRRRPSEIWGVGRHGVIHVTATSHGSERRLAPSRAMADLAARTRSAEWSSAQVTTDERLTIIQTAAHALPGNGPTLYDAEHVVSNCWSNTRSSVSSTLARNAYPALLTTRSIGPRAHTARMQIACMDARLHHPVASWERQLRRIASGSQFRGSREPHAHGTEPRRQLQSRLSCR
jgi:hypothetical protein